MNDVSTIDPFYIPEKSACLQYDNINLLSEDDNSVINIDIKNKASPQQDYGASHTARFARTSRYAPRGGVFAPTSNKINSLNKRIGMNNSEFQILEIPIALNKNCKYCGSNQMIMNKNQAEIFQILSQIRLSTNRIVLRHMNVNDAHDVYLYASDEEVTKYLTWYPHESCEATEKFIKEHMSKDMSIFAIVLDGKVIGSFDLRLVPEHNKASFGYALNRKHWGQGIMTEVLNCFLEYSFDTLGINKMESTYYKGNDASGKVMKKCGFIEEGFLKEELIIKDQYVDVYHMGLTRDKYLGR